MSRKALLRQEEMARQRAAANAALGILPGVRPPSPGSENPNALKIWGNRETMNMGAVMYQKVTQSNYTQQRLASLMSFNAVVDEIYNKVEHLTPFLDGGSKDPSTGFCLLYKLFVMRLTEKQMLSLLNHGDSPFIRALGFLYLRYCIPREDLFAWFEPYLDDPEEIKLGQGVKGHSTTIGGFCRQILTTNKFVATMFPRIPVKIEASIRDAIEAHDKANAQAGASAGPAREDADGSAAEAERRRDRRSRSRSRDRSRRDDYHGRDRDRSRRDDYHGRDRDRSRRDDYHDHDRDRSRRDDERGRDRDRSRRDDERGRDRDRSRRDDERGRDRDRSRRDDYYDRDRERFRRDRDHRDDYDK